MLCLTGTTGNIGSAVIRAIIDHKFFPLSEIVIATSSKNPESNPKLAEYAKLGMTIRHSTYDDQETMVAAFEGCSALFLVSTPRINLDFNGAAPGTGREKQHIAAIDAARRAGVEQVYYTSLAFGVGVGLGGEVKEGSSAKGSKAGVMVAHERTEAYLEELAAKGEISYVSIREGLYAESWPLYFGQYDVEGGDQRGEVVVGGDGKVAWTAIGDLGLGTAKVMAEVERDRSRGNNTTMYLAAPSQTATLEDIARVVSRVRGKEVKVKVVAREEYERVSIEDRGMDPAFVKWWAGSYEALRDGECEVMDNTLEKILSGFGREPVEWADVVEKMVKKELKYSSSEAGS